MGFACRPRIDKGNEEASCCPRAAAQIGLTIGRDRYDYVGRRKAIQSHRIAVYCTTFSDIS